MNKITKLIITFILINCAPNFRSPRDVCKDGDFYTNGKKWEANLTCSFAYLLASEGRNSKGEITPPDISKETADLLCYKAIDRIQECDKEHTLKTGISTW